MTRLYHFAVSSVVVGDPAYELRRQRGIPLGFSPVLWRKGWATWLEQASDEGHSILDARDMCEAEGVPLGLFAMRPLGSAWDDVGGTSFRIDARETFENQTGFDGTPWIAELYRAWGGGPLVCGIGSQPRDFKPIHFTHWTAPFWNVGARVSFDDSAGQPKDSPIHRCLSAPGVLNHVLIERAPRLADTHWHGFPIFGMHRGAFSADRVPLEDWPVGSIVRIEHRDPDRTPRELTSMAIALLGQYPNLAVALDFTLLSPEQVKTVARSAAG